jgi:predicted Fe-Mo cluster-binding NifX family protein
MTVAFSVCGEEIAITFDFACCLLAVEVENGREISRVVEVLDHVAIVDRVKLLTKLGVQVVICGAISRPSAALLTASGIRIIPLVSGAVREVVAAFLNGQLEDPRFLFPGCSTEDRSTLLARRGTAPMCHLPPKLKS